MFPGQNYTPHLLQGSHTENTMLRPRGNINIDLFDESMKKRKSGAMDRPGPISELTYDYSNQFGANLQKGTSWVSPGQNQAYNLDSQQRKAVGQTNAIHQFNKDQFHFQNSYAGPFVNRNINFRPNGNHNLCNVPSPPPPLPPPPPQSSAYRHSGPLMTNNINFLQNSNHNLGNFPSPTPPPPPPRSSAYGSSGPLVTSNMNFLPNSHHNFCNLPSPSPPQLPPPPPRPSAYGSVSSVNMQATEGVARPIWQSHASNAIDSMQNNQPSINTGVNGVANHSYSFPQNGGQLEVTGSFSVSASDISVSGGQGNETGSVGAMNKTGESNLKNLNYRLPGVLPISCITPVSVDASHQNSLSCPLKSDEKDKPDDGEAAPTAGEQLWEGSLQLSSTVTVPSVAFFKSGEKLLNTNWYKSVEVKGKVRLEVFDKYIVDLPCSHNKGLMLISLCWKAGSPEAGLKDMKEVARGYTRTNRVGFAHLSREIHLYICPRSEAIITILEKNGILKGIEAIEDKQDSMIGCVIWRKSGTPSNSVTKRTETKSTAPSDSSDEDSDRDDSPLTQLVQEIVAPLSASFTSTVQGVENDGKGGDTSLSKTQTEVNDILMGSQKPGSSGLSYHQAVQGGSTMVSNQQVNWLAVEQPKEIFNLQNPHIPSLNILNEKRSLDDEDDLPEFDFIASCKPSLSHLSKPPARETLDKGLSVTRGVPIEQANSLQIPSFNHLEKRGGVQNQTTTHLVSNPSIDSKNNLFDDDDMPEWCPPEHQNRSSSGIIRPETMPSKFPVSKFENSPRGPPTSLGHFHTPHSRPLLRGPSSENGSRSDSILGPPPSFHENPPLNQTNNQGWGSR